MKISSEIIKPLFYGTLILRSTNNENINQNNEINYLIINKENLIKLKTIINYNYILGLKKSKKANINFIKETSNELTNEKTDKSNFLDINFSWISKNIYTYSILL